MFFHRPSVTSTCDSAESIATLPLESDLKTNHLFVSPAAKTLCSSSSRFRVSAGRLAAVFSQNGKSSQEFHSDRESIPLAHRAVQGENEALSRLSEAENDTRLILEEQRNQLLSEAKSEVLKQECKAERADGAICELQ